MFDKEVAQVGASTAWSHKQSGPATTISGATGRWQIRLLFEIGEEGAEVGDLRARLDSTLAT